MSLFGKKGEEEGGMDSGGSPAASEPAAPVAIMGRPMVSANAAAAQPAGGRIRYTVEDAIQLMRQLPVDTNNAELVVQVVRSTLTSLNVNVADIIQDASSRQKTIQDRVATLQGAIYELEKEISERKDEIARLQADLQETSMVKERLQMGEAKAAALKPPPITSASASASASAPAQAAASGAAPVPVAKAEQTVIVSPVLFPPKA